MLQLKAYAKINLSLKIMGKRPDGFHEIESVMQSVSLCDYITLTQIPSGIQLTTSNPQLPNDNRNLAYKAAELFFRTQNTEHGTPTTGVSIYIEKNIPVAAGLAGGSADAAAVLWGLNQMSNVDSRPCLPAGRFSIDELIELGAQIGSDVPFCLLGGNCLVKGRGEKIENRKSKIENRSYVLIVPEIEVSTRWAYEEFDRRIIDSPQLIVGNNQLESVVAKKYPIIREIKEMLLNLGCSSAQMSGSGPSVFGEVKDASAGEKILSQIRSEYPKSYLIDPVPQGVETA